MAASALKIMSMDIRGSFALPAACACVLVVFLAGCASSAPRSLYHWGSYEEQVHAYLKGGSREAQIVMLERDLQKIGAGDGIAPPGFYAHLGLLYAETGNDAKAIEFFTAEKRRFPESTAFMDFLLDKYRK
jgi:hypothetical protein